ncbi:hypothetical protein GGR51DRAFT_530901 [Nemania sp. FL0031]|nr:hypothetical protein GGR51DRAFT_530901 [Nemania sp. FL0031]
MADPLSIAGLATGVISLGLQLFEAVNDYLDAVKARSREIESSRQQAENMRKLLGTIRDLLPTLQTEYPTSAAMIQHYVKPCETEIHGLNNFLLGLRGTCPGTGQSSIRSKVEEQRKKLSYPFNRTHIKQLESRLEKVNSSLQMALQLAGLHVSINTSQNIRRLYDLVAGASNRTPTDVIGPLQRQFVHTRSELRNSNSSDAVLKLASKPSYLRASLGELENTQRVERSRPSNQVPCICRPSRRTTRQKNRVSALSFSLESSSLTHHLPDCPFSQITKNQHIKSFTVEFNNLKWLLQKAVGLSFALKHGAGGFSIGPIFTYYPAVDEKIAPAFQIIALLRHIILATKRLTRIRDLISVSNYENSIESYTRVINHGFDEIVSLYRHGKASPRDINSNGGSLMNSVVESIDMWYRREVNNVERACLPGIKKLIASGVPATVHDVQGQTPAGTILFSISHSDFFSELASLFLSAGPDSPLTVSPDAASSRRLFSDCLNYYCMDLRIAEAANCGPLSLAAIAGDEHTISNLLDRYPSTCREVNDFGQTPIHLAVLHPTCLRLIVQKTERSVLDRRDKMLERALDYAATLGCDESINILIEYKCAIDTGCLQSAQGSNIGVLVSALRNRRDRLKALAVRHLSELEIRRLNLENESTLDRGAKEVEQILYERGITIPEELMISNSGLFTCPSVFHVDAKSRRLFDTVWEHKFRDIDSLDARGKPPLLVEPLNNFEVAACYNRYKWLIEHGADLWTPFPARTPIGRIKDLVTPAHFLFATIGKWWEADLSCDETPDIEVIRFLTKELLSVYASDGCSCHCNAGGCTPLAMFLRFLTRKSRWGPPQMLTRRFDNPQTLASPLVKFIREAQPNFTMEQHLAVVRYMTHEALDITHTCCRFSITHLYRSRHLPPEEVEEINSEQTYLLELLESLVIEFEQIARGDRDGMPLGLCDPEEFWKRNWVDRMDSVLKELDGDNIENKERSEAIAIGVDWDTPSTASNEVESEIEETPEYFLDRLEEIMKEYR